MKIQTTGKSLKELLEIYGTGESGFYPQDWYKTDAFFTEKPEAGEYEIDFDYKKEAPDKNKTYKEQLKNLNKDYKPVHIAILCEAILKHYKETGDKLLENTYSRTDTLGSDGDRVRVGDFDSGGLRVGSDWGGSRGGRVGLSAARKLSSNSRNLASLESLTARVEKIENWIRKFE